MTKRLQQTPPTLGPKGPVMQGSPGSLFLLVPKFCEKIIVESWEAERGQSRCGWRFMSGSHCVRQVDSAPWIGIQATANAAASWIAERSYYYGALGVK